MSVTPTTDQLNAGFDAGRKAINDYSSFYSGMIPDDALLTFVTEVVTAAFNTQPKTETPTNA